MKVSENQETTHHKGHFKEYMIVFVLLAVLTLVEIYIPEIKGITQFAKASSLTALAIVKAFMVAYFYMHLKEEKKWLKFIAAIPVFALMYTVFIVVESIVR
jgi:cytochrome c oxidase subunit IV